MEKMEVRWERWEEIVDADDVEECVKVLEGKERHLPGMYAALDRLVGANPPRIMAYLKQELKKVSDVKVRWYGLLTIASKVQSKGLIGEILGEVDYKGNELGRPLCYVCWNGDVELAQLLISKGAQVNGHQDESNEKVYQMEHTLDLSSAVVALLVKDPSERMGGGDPLGIASNRGHLEVVKVLLSHGADVNVVDRYGRSALHGASLYGHLEVVKLLISHKADVNLGSRDGNPLSLAASKNRKDVVDVLISEGARLLPHDDIDHTAFIIDEIY